MEIKGILADITTRYMTPGLGLDFVLNKPEKTFLRQLVQFNYEIDIR